MSEQKNQSNPLSAYFRAPKMYLDIPSSAKFYTDDICATPESGEFAIYPMTTKDELMLKNPDALLNGEAKAAMFTSPAFTGTASAAALNVTGDTVIAGDLTVQGTASFESTENLLVKDRFIGLASGSAGAADGGIVIEQSNVDGGKGAVFAFDGLSTGRWGVDLDFNPTASAYTPAAFMSNVVVGSDDTVPTGTYAKKGNIFIGSSENEIWIYGS